MRTLMLLLLSTLVAGCTDGGDTWHIQGVQCEAYPWGDQAGAPTESPGLEDRLEAHYGFDLTDVHVGSDGRVYADVCGGASDQHVQATVAGHGDVLRADGWAPGPIPGNG